MPFAPIPLDEQIESLHRRIAVLESAARPEPTEPPISDPLIKIVRDLVRDIVRRGPIPGTSTIYSVVEIDHRRLCRKPTEIAAQIADLATALLSMVPRYEGYVASVEAERHGGTGQIRYHLRIDRAG